MKIQNIQCSQCGAPIQIKAYSKFLTCPACGSRFIVDRDKNEGTSFERGAYEQLRDCPACRGVATMALNKPKTTWKCFDCGFTLSEKELENGMIFWFCDDCDTFLNVQPGFTSATGHWKCTECGCENDVSDDNLYE